MWNPRSTTVDAAGAIPVLCVSPREEDHLHLSRILQSADWAAYTKSNCCLKRAYTLQSALAKLREDRIAVVVCERDLLPGSWKHLLAEVVEMPDPPLLIVTSRVADEKLWAEALNLGAHDVLAKPLDVQEVIRVLGWAWLHWKNNSACGRIANKRMAAVV